MARETTRRSFVKSGAVLAAGLATSRAYGANERIRLGFIGVGNRGGQLIGAACNHADMQAAAVCDVYAPYREKWAAELKCPAVADWRELLDSKDLDAIVIAAPDHWHALMTVTACRAGKDVYVEKPLSYTIREGRKMVEVARETKRVVQVGTQRRSSSMYAQLGELVRGGKVGKVTVSRAYRISNMAPAGIGNAADSKPPADLDWNMWLGPRPERAFNENIAPYKFRWWKEYSSQNGNWGVHYFDLMRWLIGETAPVSISAHGGVFAVKDSRTIPDTMESIYEYGSGHLMMFGQYEASGNSMFPYGECELRGTDGTIYAGNRGYQIRQEKPGQFQEDGDRGEAVEVKVDEGDVTVQHMRNFLDCIKSRKTPNADVEEGHRSTTIAHLGNIALWTKSRIEWDPVAERITNNEAANQYLEYEYRKPWTLE
ncbi:MAG: Gfo/Idh/MocA family oxidoreductase [Candidatus Hydrogenedentes bacterium]|nr:Gfo/Idh/MocA family oxidoreductase [Candidatus Hydrogenedentota bacterium]